MKLNQYLDFLGLISPLYCIIGSNVVYDAEPIKKILLYPEGFFYLTFMIRKFG